MWFNLAFSMVKAAYKAGGRTAIYKIVNDPESQWDDVFLQALDALMGVRDGEKQG